MAPNFSQTLSFGSDHRGVQNAKLAATSLAIYLTDKDQIQQVPLAPFQIPEQDVLGGVHPTERHGADVQRLLHHAEFDFKLFSVIER
jgi:hypothetical protein